MRNNPTRGREADLKAGRTDLQETIKKRPQTVQSDRQVQIAIQKEKMEAMRIAEQEKEVKEGIQNEFKQFLNISEKHQNLQKKQEKSVNDMLS